MTSSRGAAETNSYITAAAVPGTSHLKNDGLTCQDAARAWKGDGVVILALSDGHGGDDYERSDVGSRLAVEAAIYVVRAAIEGWREDSNHLQARGRARHIADSVRDHTRKSLLLEWYRRVHLHDRMMAELEGESAAGGPQAEWSPRTRLYGATLLVAAVFDGLCLLLQLGDGEIVLVDSEGTGSRVFEPAEKRFGSSATNSLALEPHEDKTPAELMETACRQLGPGDLRFLLLCSDGVSDPYQPANQEARDARRQEELHTIWGSRHLEELQQGQGQTGWYKWCDQLPRRLSGIGQASGDDVSVAAAWWPEGPWTRTEPAPAQPRAGARLRGGDEAEPADEPEPETPLETEGSAEAERDGAAERDDEAEGDDEAGGDGAEPSAESPESQDLEEEGADAVNDDTDPEESRDD